MIEQDYPLTCPYCGVRFSVLLDPSGGRQQKFIQDCEVCCRPIQITLRFERGEVALFSAETNDE